jgi:ketosteroid isomerase-like protein
MDTDTYTVINRFNEVFNTHNVDEIMAMFTRDCVFEGTYPAPDGIRYEGQEAVREVWEKFFDSSPDAYFEWEEVFAAGDRAVVRWIYHWVDEDGEPGHVRGVDIFRVRGEKVVEKFSYVKG